MLRNSNIFEVFSAGARIKEADVTWERIERLKGMAQATQDEEVRKRLQAEDDKEVEQFDLQHSYEAYAEYGDKQDAMIKAADYDDRIVDDIFNLFYLCRAKEGSGKTCGYYFPRKFWKKEGKRWYCSVDWVAAVKADKSLMQTIGKKYGDDPLRWPQIGCLARFYPWARGDAMLAEFKTQSGEWKCFLSSLLPEIIDDEIKKSRAMFNEAMKLHPDHVAEVQGGLP